MFYPEVVFAVLIMNNFTTAPKLKEESSTTSAVMERYENIPKPPNDRRLYRGLKLNNEMKILLISDPLAEKSVAAVTLGVGTLNDFPEVPGLANLVLSLLMVGCRNHSGIAYEFSKVVRLRGGELQVLSTLDHQVYSFDVDPPHLRDTLKWFAGFFSEPVLSFTLPEKILDSGVHLLEEQYQSDRKDNIFRIIEAEKSMSKKNHPYYYSSDGNTETVYRHTKNSLEEPPGLPNPKKSLNNKIRKFHSMWHSSNIMSLVVLGKERLDDLEKMVVPSFKKVENKRVKKIIYPFKHHPWGEEQLMNKIYVQPVCDDSPTLRLNFPIPDIQTPYKYAMQIYVNQLLRSEAPGSLFHLLQKRSLCDGLDVGGFISAGFGFYSITFDLIEDNVEHIDDIITLTFQYIHLLKTQGIKEWIYKEFQTIQKMAFDSYQPECGDESLSRIMNLSTDLQMSSFEDILTFSYLLHEWDSGPVEELLSYLRPNNMNVTFLSESAGEIAKQNETEQGASYHKMEKIPVELIEKWKTVEPCAELHIPSPNKFLPRSFELHPKRKDEPKDPYIIYRSSILEMWFKQDNEHTPKLSLEFEIFSKVTHFSPFEQSLWHIAYECKLVPSLKQYFTGASIAGFRMEFHAHDSGILVRLYGFSDTMLVLLEMVLTKISNLESDINEENFNEAFKKYISDAKNVSEHFYQTDWHTEHVLTQGSWSVDESLNAAKNLNYEDMRKFFRKAFKRISIRGLIHGNCTRENAMDIINVIEKSFLSSRGMLPQETFQSRFVEIRPGSYYIYPTFTGEQNMFGYSIYIPYDTEFSSCHNVAGLLLYDIVERSCQKILAKYAKDPGTNVKCKLLDINGTKGLLIMMHSTNDPWIMDSKVERFLREIPKMIRNIPSHEFERFMKNQEARNYATSAKLDTLSEAYYYEINNRFYNFRRTEMELKQLRSLNKANVLALFEEMFSASSKSRRKLAVHVLPKNSKHNLKSLEGAIKFEDIADFQSGMTLRPVNFYP